jgi:hypothetical protein
MILSLGHRGGIVKLHHQRVNPSNNVPFIRLGLARSPQEFEKITSEDSRVVAWIRIG